MSIKVLGTELNEATKREALRKFVHRYTADNVPAWARSVRYRPQFADDQDWLANTYFYVRQDGRLDKRYSYCESHPTWPTWEPPFPRVSGATA